MRLPSEPGPGCALSVAASLKLTPMGSRRTRLRPFSPKCSGANASRLSASQARQRSRITLPTLKVVPLVNGINLLAGRRDLLAKLIVVGLGLLISKVRLSRLPGFPVLIEEG
jgi:hypothetical protein